MAKFYAYMKTNSRTDGQELGSFSTKDAAISCLVNKVNESHSSECTMAREALEARGYYCLGWSDREVYIEER